MNKKTFLWCLAATAYSFAAYLAILILLLIAFMSNVSTGGSAVSQMLAAVAPWVSYLFIAAIAGTGILMALVHRDKKPMAQIGGFLLLAYAIIQVIFLVVAQSSNTPDAVWENMEGEYLLLSMMPLVLSAAFAAIARCYEDSGLRIRSYVLLVLGVANLIAMQIGKNGGSVDSATGSAVVVLIVSSAFLIMETIFFFKWLNVVRNE
jgi:hypothetical protein